MGRNVFRKTSYDETGSRLMEKGGVRTSKMAGLQAILPQILLVVFLRCVERRHRKNLRDDGFAEPMRCFQIFHGFLRTLLLRIGMAKDHGAVLIADVRTLPRAFANAVALAILCRGILILSE